MAARTPFYLNVGGDNVVRVQVVKASYSAGLLTALGMTEDTTGELPQGKELLGEGREAALKNGCFPIILIYRLSQTKVQRAKVLCSPTKADTIFNEARQHTYRGKNITKTDIPKRRVLTF